MLAINTQVTTKYSMHFIFISLYLIKILFHLIFKDWYL